MKFMSVVSITKEKILIILYILIIFIGIVTTMRNESIAVFSMPMSNKVVLIDSGHGGWDPGKVGEGSVEEKDLNLKISQKLQVFLEQGGSFVIMTRTEDEALGDSKRTDMAARKHLADTGSADILVSIHQNSYTQKSVHGAQVFYYKDSEESKRLAESIQKELNGFMGGMNREVKFDTNYYILKKTTIPSVIVECGFLSNENEKNNLSTEQYQEKIAWAIYMGIVNYCKQ